MRWCVATVAFLVGCGSSTPPPAPPSNTPPPASAAGDTVIDHLRAYRDDMCSCGDNTCTRDVDREMSKWRDHHHDELAAHRAVTAEEHQLEDQLTGCETKAKAKGPGLNQVVVALNDFATRACACTDYACAQKLTEEMTKWAQAHVTDVQQDTAAQSSRDVADASKRLTDCLTKALSSSPVPPPSTTP